MVFLETLVMETLTIKYNAKNSIARKTIDYMLSLGLFKIEKQQSQSITLTDEEMKCIEKSRKSGISYDFCQKRNKKE